VSSWEDEGIHERVYEALYAHLALGNTVVKTESARYVSNPATPNVWDANHIQGVRAASDTGFASVLQIADELFADCGHRRVFVDPWTPLEVEARLTLDGYEPRAELVLLLDKDLDLRNRSAFQVDLRLVETDADWYSFERLLRLDHEEEAAKGVGARSRDLTREIAVTKRAKAPDVRFWLAQTGGLDCAFCSSWSGVNGVGIVEDLFTHQDFRHRGIATALIQHCVADARAHGAGPIVISALIDDTPKAMYAALGFRPFCVNRSYLHQPRPGSSS
jgi:GNAT superfamily N-acetyltransferase